MAQTNRLNRSFSTSDLTSAERIHGYVSEQEKGMGSQPPSLSKDVTKSTMVIPSLKKLSSPSMRKIFYESIISIDVLQDLEMEKSINWCPFSRNLLPLRTQGDGNCLLHSLSLYIWGVHDSKLTLRRLLEKRLAMEDNSKGKIYLRWHKAQLDELKLVPQDVNLTSTESRREWDTVVHMATSQTLMPGRGSKYFPLEAVHIFTMCNILARPIIVLCDAVYRSDYGGSIQPCQIGGIYLPILRHESECEKSPIVIGYEHGHFVPLMSCEDIGVDICGSKVSDDAQHCIPLTRSNLEVLPIHFLFEDEASCRQSLLQTYLECSEVPFHSSEHNKAIDGMKFVPCAMLKFKPPPAWTIQLMWKLYSAVEEDIKALVSERPTSIQRPCVRFEIGCPNVGDNKLHGLCLDCYHLLKQTSQVYDLNRQLAGSGDLVGNISSVSINNYQSKASSGTLQGVSRCRSEGCEKIGNVKFYGYCMDCYVKGYVEEGPMLSKCDIPSENPIQMPHVLQSARGEAYGGDNVFAENMANLALGSSMTSVSLANKIHAMPAVESRLPASDKRGIHTALTKQNSAHGRLTFSQTNIVMPGNNDSKETFRKRLHETLADTRNKKNFCDIPGCLEAPVVGQTKCDDHLFIKKCNTEGCSNKAPASGFGLCETCLKKLREAQYLEEEKYKLLKMPSNSRAQSSSAFEAPAVYMGFPGPEPDLSNTERVPFNRKCSVITCKNIADQQYSGYCLNCFTSKMYLEHKIKQNQCVIPKCENRAETSIGVFCVQCQVIVDNKIQECATMVTSVDQSVNVPPQHDVMVPFTVHSSVKSRECVNDFCDRLSTDMTGLCSECFQHSKQMEERMVQQRNEKEQKVSKKSLIDSEILNFVPCQTVGCPAPGIRGQGMLCNRCYGNPYKSKQIKEAQPKPGSEACRGINCKFFGTSEFGGFCSKCFMDKTKLESDNRNRWMGSRGQLPARSSPITSHESLNSLTGAVQRCQQAGCDMFGSPELGGFCSKCKQKNALTDNGFILLGMDDTVN